MKFYLIFITFIICILGASYKDYPQGSEPNRLTQNYYHVSIKK